MRLKDYIQGDRHGKDANRLEREAMSDPFLQDALDGFDAVAGNHVQIIERLEKKFSYPAIAPHRNRRLFLYWSAAASVLLLIGFSSYFFLQRTKSNTTPAIAMLQPDENEQIIADNSSTSQSASKEDTQREVTADARVSQRAMQAPASPLTAHELDVISDVIVADAIVADVDAFVANEIVSDERVSDSFAESSAKDVTKEEQEVQAIHEQVDNEAVAALEYSTQRKQTVMTAVSAISKSDAAPHLFGEKEFQTWCQEKADKNICSGQGATVKLSFFIDETGKPMKIEYQSYSCEDAKKELEKLLASSPIWTKANRKVSMTIRW